MVIRGRKFDHDLVLTWKGEVFPRKKQHEVTADEFDKILEHSPEIIIIGTGTGGAMKVSPTLHLRAKINGAEVIEAPTPQAVEEFNKQIKNKKTIGLFHLTC
jgi:hypothetical protein